MKTKIILLLMLFLSSSLFALDAKQVEQDYKKGNMAKYERDLFPTLNFENLKEMGIYSTEDEMKPETMDAATCEIKLNVEDAAVDEVFSCPNSLDADYTSAVFDTNLYAGTYQCLISEIGEKYKPIGVFQLDIPDGCKEFLKKDEETSEIEMASQIASSEAFYKDLYQQKYEIKATINDHAGSNFLNVSDILLSAILSDTDIIDVVSTKSTNRVHLHPEYNSQITDSTAVDISRIDNSTLNKTTNLSDLVSTKSATIADVYAKLSDLSMVYLFILLIFVGIFGIGRKVGNGIINKVEQKQNPETMIPYVATILIGFTLFFPVSREELQTKTGEKYEVMKSNFQKFERTGYYLFMGWASDATNVIVDSELDSIISRAGLANKTEIIYNHSSKVQMSKFYNINRNILKQCQNTYSLLFLSKLTTTNTKFPSSETKFLADNIINGNGATYYDLIPNDETRGVILKFENTENKGTHYPEFMLSACGKAESKSTIYSSQYNNFDDALTRSSSELGIPTGKIDIVKNLIDFQYQLSRDYGLLGILGLPVTIMQTENIGKLVDSEYIVEELKQKTDSSVIDSTVHSFLSSVPYLLTPGISQIYQLSKDHGMILGGVGGAKEAVDTVGNNWVDAALSAVTGGIVGGATGKFFPEVIGFAYAYNAATTLLLILPILTLFLVGLARFLIIIFKIFIYHFISIFLMPVLFVKGNLNAIVSFSMKILATMLELPIFVLSVWLAMSAHYLLKILTESFEKRFIDGMIENLRVSKVDVIELYKLYFFDGILQVALALFSVVIIYKIITTSHQIIFSLFQIDAGTNSLDNTVDTMVQDNKTLKM